jgi:uncharacterized protein YegP (UPF0339 family)
MFHIASVRRLMGLVLVSASLSLVACSASPDGEVASIGDDSAEIVSRSARFETFVGKDGQHYFSLVAGNGENVLRSEGYVTAQGALGGMKSVVANGVDLKNFEIRQAKNGEYYFNLKSAANGQIVATSETYVTESNAKRAATTVQKLLLVSGANPEFIPALRRERFEVFTGEDKKIYFHLRAGNGEIVLQSQGYTSRSAALKGIESVKANGAADARWEVVETRDGQFSIRLKAANGQIIGRGESYVSQSNATRAVRTIQEILGRVSETAQQQVQ